MIARCSAEAKYRDLASQYVKHLLRELRFGKDEQMKLICDNQVVLPISSCYSIVELEDFVA